jgi:hypothetical protein
MGANFIDDWRRVVFLLLGRESVVAGEVETALILATGFALSLARLGNRGYQFGLPPSVARRLVKRLAI